MSVANLAFLALVVAAFSGYLLLLFTAWLLVEVRGKSRAAPPAPVPKTGPPAPIRRAA